MKKQIKKIERFQESISGFCENTEEFGIIVDFWKKKKLSTTKPLTKKKK